MGKELEKVKGKKHTLKINGKEREIRFNFSAWATLEEEYGGIKNLGNLQKEIEDTEQTRDSTNAIQKGLRYCPSWGGKIQVFPFLMKTWA